MLLVGRKKFLRLRPSVGEGRDEAPAAVWLDALSFVLSALHPRLPVAFYCRRTEVRRKKTYDHGRIPNNVTGGTHSRGTPPHAKESNSSGSIQKSNRAGIEIAIRRSSGV